MDSFYDAFPIQSMAKPVKSDINKGSRAERDCRSFQKILKSIMKEHSYLYAPMHMNKINRKIPLQ